MIEYLRPVSPMSIPIRTRYYARSLEIQGTLNDLLGLRYSQVGRLATINGDELRRDVGRNLGAREVLKEDLQVWKVQIVCPL